MPWTYDPWRYPRPIWQWVPDAPPPPLAAQHEPAPYSPPEPSGYEDEIRIPAAADGRVYVNAEIDGVPFTALADPGANTIKISHPVAKALGIRWGSSDFNTTIDTSGGSMRGVTFTLPLIVVEGLFEGRNLDATIPEKCSGRNILGKNFLDTINTQWEKGTGALIMRP